MDQATKESTILTREYFIKYFRSKGHKYLKPVPVFDQSDPSLFFVNAGMNQLKDTFLGKKSFDPKFSTLTNSQMCIRTGGKHNDFDDVGRDSYHLTGFEMLGSWSLNEYDQGHAIKLAYEFLVNHCQLDPARLYATYFEGTSEIPCDETTRTRWLELLPEERVLKGNFKDNFWMMADTGPCGVSTEIHYDLVGGRDASQLVNQNDPTVIEIWNLVFIQYNKTDIAYEPLDKLWIDTGMGLARLCMILQNKETLYTTDVFRHLMGYAQALSGAEFYGDRYGENEKTDIAYRIFADHIGTVIVCLHDGVRFGMNGREFILRKVMRRLLVNYYLHLNNKKVKPFMSNLLIQSVISFVLCNQNMKKT